jgi:putative chitinase
MQTSKLQSVLDNKVFLEMPQVISKFNINSNLRLAHFLAQCAHESGNFKLVYENLNYSAKGLRATFPKYFPTDSIAQQYERQPEKIGNRVYANRMGNGDENSGMGYKFRGRGYIQLTGHDNYKLFSNFIGEDCVANPDLVATKYPLTSAAFFFERNNLWAICDRGDTTDVVTSVTKRVNGGTNGLDDRLAKFNSYKNLIS